LKGLKELIREIENNSEYMEWQSKGEIAQYALNDPVLCHFFEEGASAIFCPLCENDFSETEKIIAQVQMTVDEVIFFRKKCFLFYLEHFDEKPDWNFINSHAWPKKICALCEFSFDEELTFTDGAAYFCEECAQKVPGAHKY
jgi:hypothetical protein